MLREAHEKCAKRMTILPLLPIRIDVHDQMLSGSDLMMLVQSVPGLELRYRDLKLLGNTKDRIAAAHGVEHAAAGLRALIAKPSCARLDHQALTLHQRIPRAHVIQPGESAHRHSMAARDTAQRLAGADAIDDLTL